MKGRNALKIAGRPESQSVDLEKLSLDDIFDRRSSDPQTGLSESKLQQGPEQYGHNALEQEHGRFWPGPFLTLMGPHPLDDLDCSCAANGRSYWQQSTHIKAS